MGNNSEEFFISEGLMDHLDMLDEKIKEEKNRTNIETINVLMHDLQNSTKVIVKKYPFLVPFMEEHGCKNISKGSDINKLDKNSLNLVGNMSYYEWDHHGRKFFVVYKNGKIVEALGRIGGEIEFLPENMIDYRVMNVNELIDKSSEFLITFMDDADGNHRHMIISKLI